MNRKIKFRAWNENHFNYFDLLGDYEEHDYYKLGNEGVEQFTGLKDKNEVEIYEGDFVTGGVSGCVSAVLIEWSNIRKWSGMEDGYNKNNIGFNFDEYYFRIEQCEVIGNIHQNPELFSK